MKKCSNQVAISSLIDLYWTGWYEYHLRTKNSSNGENKITKVQLLIALQFLQENIVAFQLTTMLNPWSVREIKGYVASLTHFLISCTITLIKK